MFGDVGGGDAWGRKIGDAWGREIEDVKTGTWGRDIRDTCYIVEKRKKVTTDRSKKLIFSHETAQTSALLPPSFPLRHFNTLVLSLGIMFCLASTLCQFHYPRWRHIGLFIARPAYSSLAQQNTPALQAKVAFLHQVSF